MRRNTVFAILAMGLLCAAGFHTDPGQATELPTVARDNPVIRGGASDFGKAAGDTVDLMGPTGSGAPYLGDFEAGWNGWTSVDVTAPTVTHWQVSDYNQAVAGNLAAWCGDISYASCSAGFDSVGGYGNNWVELLAFSAVVTDPGSPATVGVTATLQHDSEGGYDFVYLSTVVEGVQGFQNLNLWDGQGTVSVNDSTTYLPSEFVGGNEVRLYFRFTSDGVGSDEDCLYNGFGAGACQVDDITVTVKQTGQPDLVSFTDFQDGTTGDWSIELPTGVGDFAALWVSLEDEDPCHTNYSRQVAFIDNGQVVPGTGGSECINWCYGPMGYIVTTTGGLQGPQGHLRNNILSPIMAWPDEGLDGITVAYDVYLHEDLSSDAPGIFYVWGVRSADTDNSAGYGVQDIASQPFVDDNFVFNGGPYYRRDVHEVTSKVNPGRDEIQVMLGVYEIGWVWGFRGNDGYPAPYFDNVSVKTYPIVGPSMSARAMDLAQDSFPEIDVIDAANPGVMHVRFDMAQDISQPYDVPLVDPGDSLVVTIDPVRDGAILAGSPKMHYVIEANPAFDDFRTTPTSGSVAGQPAARFGSVHPDKWAFDLPDTGTLFPGDVLHYYFRAGDNVGGDIRYATLPADITGFGDFSDPLAYNHNFVMRALPTLSDDGLGGFNAPHVLFWDDSVDDGDDEWYGAFANMGFIIGEDYDVYTTNQPTSGVSNGLGSRTNGPALAPYDVLVYSSGDQSTYTLGVGESSRDKSDDVGALLDWLSGGDKGVFLTGDGLATDVYNRSGTSNGYTFVRDVMGLDPIASDLRPFIANQTAPVVLAIPGNPVLASSNAWIAYGGCEQINRFDALTLRPGALRLAEFSDPMGNPGAYPYPAATLNVYGGTNQIVSLPYDLASVYTEPSAKANAPLPARARILRDVVNYFGYGFFYFPTDVPQGGARFAVANAPNPFNPRTSISYTIDQPGHLTLKIFNVRGQLVRTLIDERVETGGEVVWDGTDDQGQTLASGVYFREARLGTQVELGKMLMIK